ncbi:MAG: PAS domain S-box protein [Cyanobacteria bacterium J06638_22]
MVGTWIGFGVLAVGAIALGLWQVQQTSRRWRQMQVALQQANAEVQRQTRDRQQAELALQALNQDLETQVQQCTLELQQREVQLQQTCHFLQTVIAHLPIAVCVKNGTADHFGEILLWNKASERLFGLTVEQAMGKTATDAFLKESPSFSVQSDQETFARGIPETLPEEPIETNHLGRRLLQTTKVPLYDAQQQPQYLLCLSEDITERKQIETALQDREERLSLAMDTVKMGVWEVNLQTGEQLWSPQSEAIWGFAPGTFDGKTASFFSRIHPEDRETVEQANRDALVMSQYQAEFRIVLPDQTVRWLFNRANVYYDKTGEPIRMIGVDSDVTDRKQTEAALRQSEEYYRQLAENMPTVICRFLPDSTLTYVNSAYCQYFKKSREELIGRPFLDLLPEESDRQAAKAHYMSLTPDAPSAIYEHPVTRPDGSEGWQQWVDRAFFDKAGQVTNFQSIGFDISDRKQTEEVLRQERNLLSRIMETSPAGIFVLDVAGTITFTNTRAEQILGVPRETMLDRTYNAPEWQIQSLDGSPFPDAKLPFVQVMETKQPIFNVQHAIHRPDGQRVLLSINAAPSFNPSGQIDSVIATIEDITERKQVEAKRLQTEQVRKELKLLERILEVVLAGYWDWDIPNNTEYLSPGLKQMLGYADHELPNAPETWQRLILSEDLPGVLDCFEHHVQSHGEIPYYNEVRYRHKDGSIIWVICSGQVIEWDDQGNPLRMIGCHVNITQRKQAEQKIQQTVAQLTATNQELESFAYSVSHDLRAPLRHIHGFVNALRQKLAQHQALTDPKVQHYLEVIESSSQKMGLLIDGLLTLSRLGRKPMDLEPIALRPLVEEAVTLAKANLEEGVSIDVVIGNLPTVRGDATLLQQVLSNLVGNAFKFSRYTSAPRVEIGITEEGAIFVRDNGVGFDMKYADKLFGAFQRLHAQIEFRGTGIGLAIVQRIIHRHGGRVWAESQPNQGATFYFTVTVLHA